MATSDTVRQLEEARAPIGWDGQTLKQMLETSEERFELTGHYHGADRWAAEAIGERSHGQEWVRSASTAADAAFHLYSRGARDYRP